MLETGLAIFGIIIGKNGDFSADVFSSSSREQTKTIIKAMGSIRCGSRMSSPLSLHHEKMGGVLKEGGGVPARYGDAGKEYDAVRRNVGVSDLSFLGRLTVTGRDRTSFLNGLLTNDIANLKEHHGIRACLLTPKARILAVMHLYNLGERILVGTGEAEASRVKSTLDQFIITEDVQVHDSSRELVHLTVQGPGAKETINETFRTDVSDLASMMSREIGPGLVINRDRTGQSGYDVIVPGNEAEAVWQMFLLKGITPIGREAMNILRLEAGIPRYGVDVDENTLILEAGLKDAISFSKGCYMGQETVARATFIGRVNKHLAKFETNDPVEGRSLSGAKFYGDNRESGHVTSSAYSPGLRLTVGLGYVQRDFAKEGSRVEIGFESDPNRLPATIKQLV